MDPLLSPLAPRQLDEIDPVLEELSMLAELDGPLERGAEEGPFDLRVILPRAVDLAKVFAAAGKKVPTEYDSTLGGATIPILLNHGITPFPHDGHLPRGVWGFGYEFELLAPVSHTVAVLPESEALKIAEIGQDVKLGLSVGGKVGIPDAALQTVSAVPGVSLSGASIEATTDQHLDMSLKLQITLRKILAAPFGAGSAKWNLYRQDERLDVFHPLLQTILVPPGTTALSGVIRTWAKRKKLFGGQEFWPYPDQAVTISLTGLSS